MNSPQGAGMSHSLLLMNTDEYCAVCHAVLMAGIDVQANDDIGLAG
jgi:hypothetical protein